MGTVFYSCGPELPPHIQIAYETLPQELDFNIHVKPILSDKCFSCHGPDINKLKADLRLDLADHAYQAFSTSSGRKVISKGSPSGSELFHRIISDDEDYMMPPPEHKVLLTEMEIATLVKWIDDGAEYKAHWAFEKVIKPAIPSLGHREQFDNPIDNFVGSRLEDLDLDFSTEADRELLLRRLSFDLTGLPPSIDEIKNFMADESPDAYEKQVDRLLASVHCGEKLATDWMDLSRYSDTYGYQVDRYRDMSPWRDWVISAFNKNMPYDQFVTWQLAGDLLPNATTEQILATGFNRLHPQNMEGGIVDEEFRVENVSDRVAVLGDGILGLTLSCAKCHDHKFDPISQKEYYEIFSFFNNLNEKGQIAWDQSIPVPTLLLPTAHQKKQLASIENRMSEQLLQLESISASEFEAVQDWINSNEIEKVKTWPQNDLLAHYPLDNQLGNTLQPNQKPKMGREFSKNELPTFAEGHDGSALLLDGDAWLDCADVGIFKRSDPFSIGLWIYLPQDLKEGVIFHKNKGSRLHSFRGYYLYLTDSKLEWCMARTWPENAIIEHSVDDIPREQWIQMTVTYDGSSSAEGTHIYLDGQVLETVVEKDNLYKDIVFNYLTDVIYAKPIEPNLQIGARWRGTGIKDARVDDIFVYSRALTPLEVMQLANPKLPFADIAKGNEKELTNYYLANNSDAYRKANDLLRATRTTYVDSMESVKEVMVMEDMEQARPSFVLNRGLYDDYGEEVSPNLPANIMAMPDDLQKNRLGLAEWVVHHDNPLTARVAVNRYWKNFFGRGLVNTAQDFGNQGDMPSHPKLLDWLAVQFVESGWDVKALLKLMAMSATYKQSSYSDKTLRDLDPENIWLARGPALRLTSEMIRDNALAASELLNREVGGESVYPYQPEGLWALNFDPYPQDTGDKLYRRSMYSMWRRTNPNPTLSTFDQPARNACTINRQKTNTPLQALVLLNDPTFLEAAKVIGEQMARGEDLVESIKTAYFSLTGKIPNQKELDLLSGLQKREYEIFKDSPLKSKGLLEAGEYQIDPALDKNLIAANAVVASVILSGDVTITKR